MIRSHVDNVPAVTAWLLAKIAAARGKQKTLPFPTVTCNGISLPQALPHPPYRKLNNLPEDCRLPERLFA